MKPEDYKRKILVDECLGYEVAEELRAKGFQDISHVSDVRMIGQRDVDIFNAARENGYIVVTADKKFYKMLSKYHEGKTVFVNRYSPDSGGVYSSRTLTQMIVGELQKKFKQERLKTSLNSLITLQNNSQK